MLGLGEPDQQVQDLLRSSGGTNLGMDFLSRAIGFDPLAFEVSAEEAGRIVWFDALVNNVDRSWRNPNLLMWHGDLWLIDHGATMIWHHHWPGAEASAAKPYDVSDHALTPFGPDIASAAAELAPLVTEDLLAEVTAEIPEAWLADEPGFDSPAALRAVEGVCGGGKAAGQAAGDDAGRRFRWLIAPRSTVVQPGPVHTGLTADPEAETERLLQLLVR